MSRAMRWTLTTVGGLLLVALGYVAVLVHEYSRWSAAN